MDKSKKIWLVKKVNSFLLTLLAQQLGVSKIVAQLLINRGVCSVEEARAFLFGSLPDLHDPLLMHGVKQAVDRINKAIQRNEPILVYGDYDVDGITSTVVILETLELLGAQCSFYIPHRLSEGYGLNQEALQQAVEKGFKLVITVDCGISSVEEVNKALAEGLDIIISDHHEPPEQIPQATAVINPKQPGCPYPFKELAGVGVAFKLAGALLASVGQKDKANELLDLVALGTIADIVPLQGENRIITKEGLPLLGNGDRVGINALLEVAGLEGQDIDSTQVAFGLAPRLNATGRIGHASDAVNLLREKDGEVAKAIARAMDRSNRERQVIEAVIFEEAVSYIESHNLLENKVLVVACPDWHLGVIGIVASKLVNRYYRPVVLLAIEGERAKGSARSIQGFNLFQALQKCDEYLLKYGGHSQAAGLTLHTDKVPEFNSAINLIADSILKEEDMVERVIIDGEISFQEINNQLFDQLLQLTPYGCGNPSPLMACRGANIVEHRPVGSDGKHLKLKLREQKLMLEGIGFNLTNYCEFVDFSNQVDLVFEIQKNEWNGRSNIQLNVKEIKASGAPDNPFVAPEMDTGTVDEAKFLDKLFQHAAEYIVDDYYRNIADKDEFFTKVAGVTFDNRQELVADLREGESLRLVREPENRHDSNAVKVETGDHKQIGYLNARLARHFAPLLDRGEGYRVLVSSVTGGEEKNYGVNIVIQKLVEKDYAELRNNLQKVREHLKSLGDQELNDAIKAALLGTYPYHDSQLEALERLEEGNNTLAIFGTGRGKSAVFQSFAARRAIRRDELTIILYPLRALANDQYDALVRKLSPLGLRVLKGNGSLSAAQRAELFLALEEGEVDLLLTTPEFLSFHADRLIAMPKKIGFLVVDESHHLGMASTSHRPAYRRLGSLVQSLGNPLTLAVTATANDEVAEQIVQALDISALVVDPHVRTNLQLVDKRDIADKEGYLREVVATGGKTVIYVNSRSKAVELALMLRETNPPLADHIAYYHAGLKNDHRQIVERMFKEGSLQVIVATSAFGEGIDIPDIRHVVLYHLNFNLTEFNQQCGRGGRDGNTSQIHLLCGNRDIKTNEFILDMTAPDREFLAVLYSLLNQLNKGQAGIALTNKELAEKMRKGGIRLAKDSSVSTGLGILEELGLIRRETAGRDRQIFLNPQPEQKRSLDNSLRYLEGQEEKTAFQGFQQDFFAYTSEQLLNLINRPIFPQEKLSLSRAVGGI